MKFSRLASQEDFSNALKHFDNMPETVKTFIEIGELHKAYKIFINNYGLHLSNHEIKCLCGEYSSYLTALRDFENGEKVYVTY